MTAGRRLNFKHLRYFAAVARQGSVTGAARALHVALQTVSAQLLEFERGPSGRLCSSGTAGGSP